MMTLSRNHNHQIYAALLLSIVLLLSRCYNVDGRVGVGGFMLPTQAPPPHFANSQVLLTELLANANDNGNGFHNELQRYRERQPNYLAKWPGLRDMLLIGNDYDENGMESNDLNNMRFIQRLRQLADNSAVDLFEDARDGESNGNGNGSGNNLTPNAVAVAGNTFKEHATKKNAQFRKQYMSPCHFKICNMGRKRNALILGDY